MLVPLLGDSLDSLCCDDRVAFFFAHATPHAVGLLGVESVLPAHLQYRAFRTDLLGGLGAAPAGAAALTLRVEEVIGVHGSA